MTWVKICGITRIEDAEIALAAGADAIGLNFVAGSPRALDVERARALADAMRGKIEVVGVIADFSLEEAFGLLRDLKLDFLQLHGSEAPEILEHLPRAYKAVRVASREDVAAAERFGGDRLLVDAKVEGALGGTGQRVELALVRQLAQRRPIVLAGGLTPENVASALGEVAAFGVDVASGVERSPGIKDPDRVKAFVSAARGASSR